MSMIKQFMEVQADADDLRRIGDRIRAFIDPRLAEGETVYLSQLGKELGDDNAAVIRLTKKKLADFVADTLGYDVRRGGAHNNILFVAPAGTPEGAEPTSAPPVPRSVMLAFTTPIEHGQKRVLNLTTLRFGPPGQEDDPREAREISSEFIVTERSGSRLQETIEKWIAKEGLTISALQLPAPDRVGGKTLLDGLLDALDGDQLRRIVLPLDVIQTLRDRPLRKT